MMINEVLGCMGRKGISLFPFNFINCQYLEEIQILPSWIGIGPASFESSCKLLTYVRIILFQLLVQLTSELICELLYESALRRSCKK